MPGSAITTHSISTHPSRCEGLPLSNKVTGKQPTLNFELEGEHVVKAGHEPVWCGTNPVINPWRHSK